MEILVKHSNVWVWRWKTDDRPHGSSWELFELTLRLYYLFNVGYEEEKASVNIIRELCELENGPTPNN
jgi:hypothetical protein